MLADAGYRVIVPHLRGYGTTAFRSADEPPQRPAVGVRPRRDRADGRARHRERRRRRVRLGRTHGQHPRRRWPERFRGHVSVSGYLIGSREANARPLPPHAELAWWYQYYFATERGRAGYEQYRNEFARLIWQTASPHWAFDDATFDRSAASFDNPDHVDIVIHNYRWRLGLADGGVGVRRSGAKAGRAPVDRRSHHHPGGRRQWGSTSGCRVVSLALRRRLRAPGRHRRRRPQPSAGSAAGVRRRGDGRRPVRRAEPIHLGGTHV